MRRSSCLARHSPTATSASRMRPGSGWRSSPPCCSGGSISTGRALPCRLPSPRARNPARESLAVAGSHLLMIAGVVLAGVGFELYIVEPLGRPEPLWLIAILGGPALFLAGRALLRTAGLRPNLPITAGRPARPRPPDPGHVVRATAGHRCRRHCCTGRNRRLGRVARPGPRTRATRPTDLTHRSGSGTRVAASVATTLDEGGRSHTRVQRNLDRQTETGRLMTVAQTRGRDTAETAPFVVPG